MKLSIIIPIYNAEKWIEKCINNLRSFRACDLELILVDDGSTDQSLEICNALKDNNPTIKVLHQKNRGVSSARNFGLASATGQFVMFHDVDDELDISALDKFWFHFEQIDNVDLVLLGARFDYYYRNILYRKEKLSFKKAGILTRTEWESNLCELASCNALNSVWAKIFRRSIIAENQLMFNANMFLYEDLEFVLKYIKCCKNMYNYPESIYHYRINEKLGNPGKRLRRISNLNDYIKQIEDPFKTLIDSCTITDQTVYSIIVKLYLVLAIEKSDVSSIKSIYEICNNAERWFVKQDSSAISSLSQSELNYVSLFSHKRVLRIWLLRHYIKLRHSIALVYKSMRTIVVLHR